MKRALDILLSSILLILASPILLVGAVAVVWESGLPILFLQQRVGLGCRRFTILKFRSMRVEKRYTGAMQEGTRLSREEMAQMRLQYQTTSPSDLRLTRVGKIMRRYYIDEIPQLINVLKGDMSLVGPRPDAPVQEVDYTPEQWRRRHSVRPGITGIAQICGGKTNTPHKRISLDIMYTRRPTICRDVWVLYRTGAHVIFKGSY